MNERKDAVEETIMDSQIDESAEAAGLEASEQKVHADRIAGEINKLKDELAGTFKESVKGENVNLSIFYGDVHAPIGMGGDMHFGQDKRASASNAIPVSDTDCEWIRGVYVPFPLHSEAKERLLKHRVLFLYGDKFSGKYTAAVSLLLEAANRPLQLYPTLTAEQLDGEPFEGRTGYVLDGMLEETLRALDEARMKRIMYRLEQSDSYLVVTVHHSHAMKEDLHGYCICCEMPANRRELLSRHAACRLKPSQSMWVDEKVEDGEFDELLRTDLSPRDYVELIGMLPNVIAGTCTMQDLYASLRPVSDRRVNGWFDGHQLPEDYPAIMFFIALAVFEEESQSEIVAAQNRLFAAVMGGLEGAFHAGNFLPELERLIHEMHARVERTTRMSEYGSVPVDIIRFVNEHDREAVLTCAWNRLFTFRPKVLEWLEGYIDHKSATVRRKAAEAIGRFGRLDFHYVKENILQSLAKHSDQKRRLFAVQILMEIAEDEQQLTYIGSLLHAWASNKTNLPLRWTSAVAYGTPIGVNLGFQPFSDLYALAHTMSQPLVSVVYNGLEYLFRFGTDQLAYSVTVLELFEHWHDHADDHEEKAIVLMLLLQLLVGGEHEHVHALLGDKFVRTGLLPRLLLKGLYNGHTRKSVSSLLTLWVEGVHEGRVSLKRFEHLLHPMIAMEESTVAAQDIVYLLRSLSRGSMSETADQLYQAIM